MRHLLREGDFFHLFAENLKDYAVFLLDTEGRVATWNVAAERILGYREDEILGRPSACFFTPEQLEHDYPRRELEMAAATGKAGDDRWQVRKDGSWFFANGVTVALCDEAGTLQGFAKILRDYTERKRLDEELQSRAEALARADRAKDEFLAVLAHELRNPMAPIFNALHLLDRHPGDERTERQAKSIIERQVRQLARLIDDLLDVSRITLNKIELRKERVELHRIVENAVQTAYPLIDARRHELTQSLPAETVWLEGDATRLEQVVANLLNNAAKYTEPGGRIHIGAERQRDQVVLRVRDTGVGIPPELLASMFDPFTQGSRTLARSQGGLGVGLTLARKLLELHGGTIEAHSEGPEKGSELTVRLPVAEPGGGQSEQPSPPTKTSALRVLVVDDSEDTAETMGMLLHLAGHEVRLAFDGLAAVEMATADRPDAILLDIGLPVMDGYEVARRLRQNPAMREVVLIAASGYGQETDKAQSREAGFDVHLVKPIDPQELLRLLGTIRKE
ncbi:MAG TPA: ATP-binding protein [Thermoanaerobaculia bacterium]|nr:ATP-binding protein [Thermoanaerobaculia bacterium]